MKAKCIKECKPKLTLNKEYEIYKTEKWINDTRLYYIKNDLDEDLCFPEDTDHLIIEADKDMVNHPSHYNYKSTECKDIINVMVEGLPPRQAYLVGAIVKYLYRYPKKGKPIQDLEKLKTYVDMIIELLESEE